VQQQKVSGLAAYLHDANAAGLAYWSFEDLRSPPTMITIMRPSPAPTLGK